ncbi:hypothetical protein Droror1_Dr00019612 [Drosera rotundifolia]
MAKLLTVSQSSLLLPQFQIYPTTSRWLSTAPVCSPRLPATCHLKSVSTLKDNHMHVASFRVSHALLQQTTPWKGTSAASDFDAADLSIEGEEVETEEATSTGTGDGFGDGDGEYRGGSGGGGGGGGGDGKNTGDDGPGENSGSDKKAKVLSMSQKLTLAYALLVGLGGAMGYLKTGSLKSLAAGGLSSLLLFFVYIQLPTKPALASTVGLGISAALLVVMGSRFKNSGKVFPAGVVSLASLIMTGGYLHGILLTTR